MFGRPMILSSALVITCSAAQRWLSTWIQGNQLVFPAIPNERYDVDSVNNRHIWTTLDGQRVVSNFERLGHWYVFDLDAGMQGGRTNPQGAGMPNIGAFVRAHQYTDEVTWTAGIDPKTGMPLEYDPTLFHPDLSGFPGWRHAARERRG